MRDRKQGYQTENPPAAKVENPVKEKAMRLKIREVDKIKIITLQDNYVDLLSGDNTDIVQRALPFKDGEAKNSILAEKRSWQSKR